MKNLKSNEDKKNFYEKKTLNLFFEKLMRATKKTSKKSISGKMFFISSNELFLGICFGNAQPKSNAHAHLIERKKHSGQVVSDDTIILNIWLIPTVLNYIPLIYSSNADP